ncbi:MAG: RdgB/HAM1 family non-canonical purine NTP pyrophosphatase [Verrucomicrobia bacterium]|nr:RdgB/HAM1 family non-canonical purine NTP pyrophosphatase [Verrucomicrobiota bacterium]MDA1085950.1 RdgB/HAM1 family non-canonical purine NTP pyrophosphatase [Verrucomicrobiota bacterium]
MNLFIATRNPGKLDEIRAILDLPGLDLVSCADIPGLAEVVEDGETLEQNAVKKAVELARASGLWALADDTGLEVDALDGAPGVISARYAGDPPDAGANMALLLKELRGIDDRRARFRTVIALSSPCGDARALDGVCEGSIATERSGNLGFGYDPIFRPAGYRETFAELSADVKNRISHRALALQHARSAWRDLLLTPTTE